jgi:TetR/AcrR family transcriptional regulator, transcriptional repressor for nem operon
VSSRLSAIIASVDTRERILDIAEELVQTRGFNAFSYADVAAELGITKAGLHYHFAGKAELGEALVARYADRFSEALAKIDRARDAAPAKLAAYMKLYASVLRKQRMCLCGMLAAEFETLPPAVTRSVRVFLDDNERWLAEVLEEGRTAGSLSFEGTATDAARMLIGALEGAMLVARPYRGTRRFDATARTLLASFTPPPGSAAPRARSARPRAVAGSAAR